jgi:hypothetical protein
MITAATRDAMSFLLENSRATCYRLPPLAG